MFFFKKKKIVVDAFTHAAYIHDYFKIKKAIDSAPDWWKKLPKQFMAKNEHELEYPVSTLKRCDGFLELYKSGFVFPLWSDLIIETYESNQWKYQFADNSTPFQIHGLEEMGNTFNHVNHGKILSPWVFKEKIGVKFYWAEPMWNNMLRNYDVRVLPGVVNYKYQHSTHINIFLPKKAQRIELFAGDPMVHIIPLSESDVEIRTHLVSHEEQARLLNDDVKFAFTGKYKKKVKLMDQANKCPFHK
jgi:hypothetical protein